MFKKRIRRLAWRKAPYSDRRFFTIKNKASNKIKGAYAELPNTKSDKLSLKGIINAPKATERTRTITNTHENALVRYELPLSPAKNLAMAYPKFKVIKIEIKANVV